MKTLSVITATLFLAFGVATSPAQNPERISTATGVPIETLQAERASTGLGWGSLEKAHLLSKATGQSFDDVVALHQSGHGWGKIAHDNGLNLGKLVSTANHSSQATAHAQNLNTVHRKSKPWLERHGSWQEHDDAWQECCEYWQRSHLQDDYEPECQSPLVLFRPVRLWVDLMGCVRWVI